MTKLNRYMPPSLARKKGPPESPLVQHSVSPCHDPLRARGRSARDRGRPIRRVPRGRCVAGTASLSAAGSLLPVVSAAPASVGRMGCRLRRRGVSSQDCPPSRPLSPSRVGQSRLFCRAFSPGTSTARRRRRVERACDPSHGTVRRRRPARDRKRPPPALLDEGTRAAGRWVPTAPTLKRQDGRA